MSTTAIAIIIGVALVGLLGGLIAVLRTRGNDAGAEEYNRSRVDYGGESIRQPRSASAEVEVPTEQPAPQQPDVLSPETIFISYDRDDWEAFVQPLVIDLRQRGFKVWIDQLSIRRGANWSDAIQEALDTCERMVLCVSPNSMKSSQAKNEYRYFMSMNKTVIPLALREARTPYDLASIQFISYEDRDVLIQELRE